MSYLLHTHFKKGDQVEVLKQENGPNTLTYYAATVLRSPAKLKTQILIKYQTLMNAESDARKPITELVDLARVRPMPPRELIECFKNGDSVDVFCDNGWQKGTVKDILENSKFVVGFDGKSEGIVAEQRNLRLHRDWDHDESSWVPPLLENKVLPATDTESSKVRLKIKCSSRKSEPMFRTGTRVEVKSDEEGYVGAWFDANIIGTIGNDKLLVQYLNLVTDDETAPLREVISAEHARPCPPPIPSDAGFKEFEKVDVWFNEGWWEGQVSEVLPGSKYMVYFRSTNEELEFDHSSLRHHQKWIDGKWVQGDERIPKAEFSKGTMVEVRSNAVGFQGAWFAATILNVMENDKFEVKYQRLLTDDETDFLREQASASDIRPSPPHIEHDYPYRLFEMVDAWYNDAWWVGRIAKVHTNSKYTVHFKTTEELEFGHYELRPHQEWVNGYWVTAPMDWGCDF
eukprot:XP_025013101.1 DUF724 domain-containing protein 2 [Ricinus communis]